MQKVFNATPIDVLCSNFVKFGRWEIGEIVRCLPNKNCLALQLSVLRVSRLKSARASPDNVLRVLQILSNSVYFWRISYSRTRKHRRNEPQSESNIRLKSLFEPNYYDVTYCRGGEEFSAWSIDRVDMSIRILRQCALVLQ